MAGLACGEVSLIAWQVLETGADAFMTIPDAAAVAAMRALAAGTPPVVAGESGVGGLAGPWRPRPVRTRAAGSASTPARG
jgi:diaminopropionate ammonia-lyase